MEKQKAIVNLAAGKSQLIVIKKAKELGFAVIAVDRNHVAPGFNYCDAIINNSTYEAEPIIDALEKLSEHFELSGIINRSAGPPVVTCAKLCQHFLLPGVPLEFAEAIVNKARLFEACQKHDIAVPNSKIIEQKADLHDVQLASPAIVKPALSILGKGGVALVKTASELSNAYDIAKECSLNGLVMIQDYIPGSDVALMGLVQDGDLIPITLLDEINKIDKNGQVYGAGFAIPSIMSRTDIEQKLIEMAKKVISSFALQNTFFNLSCRMDNKGNLALIEIHLDLGGDLILDQLIPAATDFDLLKIAISGLAGESINKIAFTCKPTAIIYGEGDDIISERPFKILQASDRISLQEMIELA